MFVCTYMVGLSLPDLYNKVMFPFKNGIAVFHGRSHLKKFQKREICDFNMCVCMCIVHCFRFNIPKRKQNVRKGFYEYFYPQQGPRSHKTAHLITRTSAQEKLKYKFLCSDKMYKFWNVGWFCQILACGKIKELY